MVRGRRGRTAKNGVVLLQNGLQVAASFVDEPNCASPKRKDCKIDASLNKNILTTDELSMKRTSTNSPLTMGREKRTAAAAAALYVRECLESGQSKTRSQNIRHYFKTNTTNDIPHHVRQRHIDHQDDRQLIAALSFDLSEEDTCTDIFGKYEAVKEIPLEVNRKYNGRCRTSPKKRTENIFLQEPVLSLNVDKSPNQASSIKINKTFEVEPVFSAQPMSGISLVATGYQSCLNGQFNKIVSLNTSPKRENSLESTSTITSSSSVKSPNNSYLFNIDNSSCDSGVAFMDNKVESSPSRRRKPATPHRIVCPSPIKSSCPTRAGMIVPSSPLSPSKKNTNLTVSSLMPLHQNNAQRRHPKSRRRLNKQEYENKCLLPLGEPLLHTEDSGNSSASSSNHVVPLDTPIDYSVTTCHTKGVLHSAKNPTAVQNTNNNYKKLNNAALNGHVKGRLHATPANTNGNRELSEFFPVRRSVRKTKTVVKEEMMRSLEKAILEERADGLKVIEHFEGKGRGIIAERPFQRGEFVVEYIGDLIDMNEANSRERKYALDENTGCYMYYFKHKNQQYCIDATAESGKLGRLVNHSRNGNLITKVIVVKNRPHLVLIAKDDIEPGEELTYDYGDRSKEALLHHPWLAF